MTNAGRRLDLPGPGHAVARDRTRRGGQFVYLRDVRSGLVWSATYQPTCREPEEYLVTFQIDRASFRRLDDGIETQLEIRFRQRTTSRYGGSIVNRSDQRARSVRATSSWPWHGRG